MDEVEKGLILDNFLILTTELEKNEQEESEPEEKEKAT